MIPKINSKIKILLVGGGTGGHFYPLISIAESLSETTQNPDLYYAGPKKYDGDELDANNIKYLYIPAGKRRKYFSIFNFFDFFKTILGLFVAVIQLFIIYPDVVMSKGGYTSVPVTLAAGFLRIPIIIHESDSIFGSANRFAGRFAKHIITAYDIASINKSLDNKIINLGIPIRKALQTTVSRTAIEELEVDPNRPIVLVLGGSQGAERLNDSILATLDELLSKYTVIHQTGERNLESSVLSSEKLIPDSKIRKYYHPIGLLDAKKLNDAYHLSSVVICRAGSTTLYEIALHKKPAIVIPIPEEISRDQRSNAYEAARNGWVVVVEEKNLSDDILASEVKRIVQNPEIYDNMVAGTSTFIRQGSSKKIADLILKTAEEHL